MAATIPVLHVQELTLAAAYERALHALYRCGVGFRTQYDRPGDPLSIDCTMSLTVMEPLSDPMIHRAFPGDLNDLRKYTLELMGRGGDRSERAYGPHRGTHPYTCYERLYAYGRSSENEPGLNQVDYVIERLAEQPFTRQAQMIAWRPPADCASEDPPSLQSLWYRLLEDDDGSYQLCCNMRYRSNDAWGSCFINLFGFSLFNRDVIAKRLAERLQRPVKAGRMHWLADSFHIYGKDIRDVERRMIHPLSSTAFSDRVLYLAEPEVRRMFDFSE